MSLINLTKDPAPIALLVAVLKPDWNFKGLLLDVGFGVPTCSENDAYYANCAVDDVYNSGLNIVEGQFLVYNGTAFEIKELTVESPAPSGTGLDYVSTWRSCPTVSGDANVYVPFFSYELTGDTDRQMSISSSSYLALSNHDGFAIELLMSGWGIAKIDLIFSPEDELYRVLLVSSSEVDTQRQSITVEMEAGSEYVVTLCEVNSLLSSYLKLEMSYDYNNNKIFLNGYIKRGNAFSGATPQVFIVRKEMLQTS